MKLIRNVYAQVALAYIGYAVLYSARKVLSVIKPDLEGFITAQSDKKTAESALSLIENALLFAYAVGQFFLVHPAEKLGIRKSLGIVVIGCILCCCAFTYPHSKLQALAWLINGGLQSVTFPLFVVLLTQWVKASSRTVVLCFWTTSQQIGSILITVFSHYLDEKKNASGESKDPSGWKSLVLYNAALILALGGIVVALIREKKDNLLPQSVQEVSSNSISTGSDSNRIADPLLNSKNSSDDAKSAEVEASIEPYQVNDEKIRTVSLSLETNTAVELPPTIANICFKIPHLILVTFGLFFMKLVRYVLVYQLIKILKEAKVPKYKLVSCWLDVGSLIGAVIISLSADKIFKRRRLTVTAVCILISAGCIYYLSCLLDKSGYSNNPVLTQIVMWVLGFALAGPDSLLGAAVAADLVRVSPLNKSVLGKVTGLTHGCGSLGAVLQSNFTWAAMAFFDYRAKKRDPTATADISMSIFVLSFLCIFAFCSLISPLLDMDWGKSRKRLEAIHAQGPQEETHAH